MNIWFLLRNRYKSKVMFVYLRKLANKNHFEILKNLLVNWRSIPKLLIKWKNFIIEKKEILLLENPKDFID